MAISNKQLNDALRNQYLEMIKTFLEEKGEEVLITGNNEVCFPCVDSQQNDKFVQVIVKVPTGSRDGDAFDGYSLAEEFQLKQNLKAQKKKEDAEKKKKKIERDARLREEKRKLKEKGE